MPDALWKLPLLFAAAFVAGGVNAVAGGGTVVSFPALLWAGVDPVAANATNAVALWPGMISGAWGFRRHVADDPVPAALLSIPALAGGIGGAVLVLRLPASGFAAVAPWMVLGASLLIAVRGTLEERAGSAGAVRRSPLWWAGAAATVLLVSTYGGYFGAGMGILLLATLGLLGFSDIHRMNGVKNVLSVFVKGAAIVAFALGGRILWATAGVMAAGSVLGALASARLAHRVGRRAVRRAVVVIGLGLGLSLVIRLLA